MVVILGEGQSPFIREVTVPANMLAYMSQDAYMAVSSFMFIREHIEM